MKKVLITIIVILLIAVLGIAGYFIWRLNEKIDEQNNQISTLTNVIKENKEKNSIAENTTNTTNSTINDKTETNTTTGATSSSADYSKYMGRWADSRGEIEIKNIGNNGITFSWGLYRLGGLDDVTIPFSNGKAVFYYQGYSDNNYNNIEDDGEHYYRKGTIILQNNMIVFKIEDTTYEEISKNNSLDKSKIVNGGTYLTPETYQYNEKTN